MRSVTERDPRRVPPQPTEIWTAKVYCGSDNALQTDYISKMLLGVRLGPGAAVLPKEIYRINLQFAKSVDGGHMGPRKFWRNMLPRLKYHNPTVDMNVDRTVANDGPATLTLFFHSQSSSTPTTPAEQTDPNAITKTINMKNKTDTGIWEEFVTLTDAKAVRPTEEDTRLLQELAEQNTDSAENSARQKEENKRIKRERQLLQMVKQD
ncbi:hypothetical protein NA57DRAFT_75435 [Rhizodiscina lignyota]|uniref:Ribosomal protein/NADH dehydrogenase domain-containing protein n=1 Tax=Rhizodiscina lignyota TaxID=1504668 RepID=A0A9P4IH65_9PEZI|nr:hypothetical protein NA57DRAFT_75435 [Rhizodiscina lignyota]